MADSDQQGLNSENRLPRPAAVRILLLEDDATLARALVRDLENHGYVVDHATTGRDALLLAVSHTCDLLILDRMVPDRDGLSVLQLLRATGTTVPALFLTALDGIDDRVAGFAAGGDDYLVKPFAMAELLARIGALVRRPAFLPVQTVLKLGDLALNLLERTATRGTTRIALQQQEFRLLEYLMRSDGRMVTRKMLLEHVWHFDFDPKTTLVETHISRLRAKIDQDFEPKLLKTIRGAGYRLCID